MAIINRSPLYVALPWRRDRNLYWPTTNRTWAPTASGIYVPTPTAGCYTFRDSDVSEVGSTTVTFNFNLGGPATTYVFCAVFQQNGGSYTVSVNGQNLTLLLDCHPVESGQVTLWGGSVTLGSDPNSISWIVTGGSATARILHAWTVTASTTTPLDVHALDALNANTITTNPASGDAILAGAWFISATSSNFSGSTATPAGDRAETVSVFGMTTADWTSAINTPFSAIAANNGGRWIDRWRCTAEAGTAVGQYDYPLPPRPLEYYQPPERQLGLNLALLVQPAAEEFIPAQYDYPLPPQLPWPTSARTWIQRGILVVPTNPFVQLDWPVPQRPPIAFARAISAFIPLLHSVQPPERQDQWPVPVQPYRVYAQSAAPPVALTAAQPFNLEDWPQPIRPPIVYAPAQGAFISLLHSIQPPISQEDWPQPTRPYTVRSVSYGTPETLLGVQPTPFVETDWPVPTPPYRVYAQWYASPTALISAPQPFALEDWPLPKQPPIVYSPAVGANIKLLHSIAPPIAQTNWPVPIQPHRVYAASYGMGPTVLGVTPTPFFETDWPVPVQPYRVYAEFRRAPIGLLHSIKPPNAQDDWPLPIPPYRVCAQSSAIPIAITGAQPFNQEDWPQPIRPPIAYSPAIGANVKLLHSIQPPISQTNWPIPTPPYRVYAASYSIPETVLTPPIPPFPRLYDWPGPIPPYRVYAEVRRADISLLHSIKPPNAQTDWPTPRRAPTAGITWINATAALLQPAQPFAQTDWPNPRLAFQPPSLRTWVPSSLALLSAAVPIGQSDWPTPRRIPAVPAKHFPLANAILIAASTRPPNAHVAWPQPIRPPVPPARHFPYPPGLVALALTKPFSQTDWPKPRPIFSYLLPSTAETFGTWVGTVTPAPVARFPTEGRFRSPLQAENVRPGVPDQRRPGQSAIKRPSNESPPSARDRSCRYDE